MPFHDTTKHEKLQIPLHPPLLKGGVGEIEKLFSDKGEGEKPPVIELH